MDRCEKAIATARALIKMNPYDPDVARVASDLRDASAAALVAGPDLLSQQLDRLYDAAVVPANNYARIASITASLKAAAKLAEEPGNEPMRAAVARVVRKVAGLFAEVDTADQLTGKSLEQIESAVHSLYGKQNDPSVYNFSARGKGHHTKTDAPAASAPASASSQSEPAGFKSKPAESESEPAAPAESKSESTEPEKKPAGGSEA